ncbi:MAG: hypothetical protein IKM43_02605 [Clostridia bacterium]|nr:hypothetical protein [Clostridia bacterium]
MSRNSWASEYQNRTTRIDGNGLFSIEKDMENSKGLYLNGQYLCDLMGHEWKFFNKGVLLSIREDLRDFEESRSFIFYNNEGVKILDIHNRRKDINKSTNKVEYLRPNICINVEVFEDYLSIEQTCLTTNVKQGYTVDIATGKKFENDLDTDQLSIEF